MLTTTLFQHLNPARYEQIVEGRPVASGSSFVCFRSRWAPLEWERLEVLKLEGILPLWRTAGPSCVAAVQLPTLGWRRTLRIHLSTLFLPSLPTSLAVLRELEFNRHVLGYSGMQERSIVLVVRLEEEKVETELAVQQLQERWRDLFTVELEKV